MLLGPGNEIVVSDMDSGIVFVLKDKNKKVLMQDLDQPYGLAFHQRLAIHSGGNCRQTLPL
jgi:hypothetical protein